MAKKQRIATDSTRPLENNALAGLGALMADVPGIEAGPESAEPVATEPEPETAPAPAPGALAGRLLVRREKKGRGGKAVTVIEGLRAEPAELESLARRLRKDLGCGSHVEAPHVVLHGAQTDRARAWLLARGATKVIVGN